MQHQHITTVTTIIPSGPDSERYAQSIRIGERDQDLSGLASVGYSLAHTTTIPGPGCVTIIDTLTRHAND
ncbi:MAG: hypothetical protein ACTH8F_09745 [Microbacterium sp.]|uniref:hypothetical protein n=1 Tax=Microbacterium sp. TaxID=51671 RepID=UPI003F95FEB8